MLGSPQSDPGTKRNRLNLGKVSNQISAWIGIAVGSVITVAVLTALLVAWHFKLPGSLLVYLGFFLLVGLGMSVGGLISVRQLRRPGNVSADVSQFANANQWNVKVALPAATAAAGETVVDWMGPMTMGGRGFAGSAVTVISKETDHNPFNTLLLTTSQLIGIFLAPDDLSESAVGSLRAGMTTLINQSNEDTFDKNVQFDMVNRSRWDQIVASAMSQGLQAALADHLNFGLPYAKVQSFSVSKTWVNAGLVFKLRDGRKMKCVPMARKQIDRVAQSLSPYVQKV